MSPAAAKRARLALVLLAIALATWQRACAVDALPVDFDERRYLEAAFDYAERMAPGRWSQILDGDENREHPPLVKLAFGVALRASGAPEPDWERVPPTKPLPEAARPAFEAGRWASAVAGIGQVAIAAAIHPLAGLLLAGEAYHAKYTAQAYLDAIPGLLFALALLVFERATREPGGARRPVADLRLLAVTSAFLGAAAAGKYPFGAVGLLALAPLTILSVPRRPMIWLALAGIALVTFAALDPFLWADPVGRLFGSVGFHFVYGQSESVRSAGLPWYQQFVWLFRSGPTEWHPGLFPVGHVTRALVPLALIGMPIAVRRRTVWAVATAVGLAFLLVWPVKWPQYLLLILVPLSVCAAQAPASVAALARRLRARRAPTADPA